MEFHGKKIKYEFKEPLEAINADLAIELISELTHTAIDFAESWLTKENAKKLLVKAAKIYKKRRREYYDIDEYGMDKGLVETIRPFFQFLYHKYWKVKAIGVNNIPKTGPAIIVANHSGTLPYDSTMINMAVWDKHPKSRYVRFLVEDFVYYFPFLGTFMNRVGGVRACQENADRLLKQGELIAVFPEGVNGIGKLYKDRYKVLRLGRGGFVKLAIKARAPIIPVAVVGAEEIHPILYKSTVLAKPFGIPYLPVTYTWPHLGLLGLIPLPSKWYIIFGKPIDLSKYPAESIDNSMLIHKLSEMVRKKIQGMIDEGLKKRGSPW